MPARFMGPALQEFKELAEQRLKEQRLPYKSVYSYGTPRRLVLYIKELASVQETVIQEVKGPAARVAFDSENKFTRAAYGFAKSQGIDVKDLTLKTIGPVDYVYATIKKEGRPANQVLQEMCPALISDLRFPKSMRWGNGEIRFARPVRWMLSLYGEQVIPFSFAGVTAGRVSYGHRFFNASSIVVESPADYFEKMRLIFVLIDPLERRRIIWQQVQELAAKEGGRAEPDQELLEEVSNLLEYPTAVIGSFEQKFLSLPKEVLITTMREHQRFFPVYSSEEPLMARFIAISNNGENELIRSGYERVLRARLADAAFFWKEDLKTPLTARLDSLKKIVWQENLGTLYEKVERITSLAFALSRTLGIEEKDGAFTLRAARLAKADLTTSMVYEFPELQGIMGREYALQQGEEEAVARAIDEHYLPRFSGDKLPSTMPGRILAIADKMDTLTGCFAAGKQPTGSQDPYALRRNALGVCHVIMEGNLIISLREAITWAYQAFSDKVKLDLPLERVLKDLEEFFYQRIRNILIERGLPYDTCDAVLSSGIDDIYGAWQRATAFNNFRRELIFDDLLTAFHRAYNISQKHHSAAVDISLAQHPSEQALYYQLIETAESIKGRMKDRDYQGAFTEMAGLKPYIDNFFNGVMVMAEEEKVRLNRLGLLKMTVDLFLLTADLSKIS